MNNFESDPKFYDFDVELSEGIVSESGNIYGYDDARNVYKIIDESNVQEVAPAFAAKVNEAIDNAIAIRERQQQEAPQEPGYTPHASLEQKEITTPQTRSRARKIASVVLWSTAIIGVPVAASATAYAATNHVSAKMFFNGDEASMSKGYHDYFDHAIENVTSLFSDEGEQ